MKDFFKIRKNFVRQIGQNDCGIACLAMILNYNGRKNEIHNLFQANEREGSCTSVLELKNLAGRFNLQGSCVTMDFEHLKKINSPCILHMINDAGYNHYQVCYGSRQQGNRTKYLMADPARQCHYIDEDYLGNLWKSRGALYFDQLNYHNYGFNLFAIIKQWRAVKYFPPGLLISIPVLAIFTAFFGIAISWILQKGLTDSFINKPRSLLIALVALLFLISLAKSLFSFIRQRILIEINLKMNKELMIRFIRKLLKRGNTYHSGKIIRMGMSDLQKMQNGMTAFVSTLLSEGALILLTLSALYYFMALAFLLNAVYLLVAASWLLAIIPRYSFQNNHLNELSSSTEYLIAAAIKGNDAERQGNNIDSLAIAAEENHLNYLKSARKLAVKTGKMTLVLECWGTLIIILVFSFGVNNLRSSTMDYGSFMIVVLLTYFNTVLMLKILNALFSITEAFDACRQHALLVPG